MATQIPHTDILDALARTGFPLEHQVTQEFRRQKWNVLSGRYYIDDLDGQARELDLIAYRTYSVGPMEVVSTVLVSCKKEAENTWAFLSRQPPTSDKNLDWCPIHIWTDEQPLASFIQAGEWKEQYEVEARKEQPGFHKVERDIFAYQVIAPPGPQQRTLNPKATPPAAKAAAPRNDAPIFSSVTGLLKALHYEKSTLPTRMAQRKRVYVFHLVVVVDGPMVDVRYEGKAPDVHDVCSILHLARYIVAGQQTTALVQFESAADLPGLVKRIDALGKFDAESVRAMVPLSYKAIEGTTVVQEHFAKQMRWSVLYDVNRDLAEAGLSEKATTFAITAGIAVGLALEIDVSSEALALVNQHDSHAWAEAAKLLRKLARYTGSFEFVQEIPF